jgi:hypothetical protein
MIGRDSRTTRGRRRIGPERSLAILRDPRTQLLKRQIALCTCVRMNYRQIAMALGISTYEAQRVTEQLLDETGMSDRFEFAVQQNAAVREKYWDWAEAA